MSLTIGGITVDSYIETPVFSNNFRARSVLYSLDGTAKEDRLGGSKKAIKIQFSVLPASVWENLKNVLGQKTFSVSGAIGSLGVSGTYRLKDEELNTPVLYVHKDGTYYCQPFSVNIEEV